MNRSERRLNLLIISTLLLSVISLFIEQMELENRIIFYFTNFLDFLILFFLITEVTIEIKQAAYKTIYLRKNVFSLLFVLFFILLFLYNKIMLFSTLGGEPSSNAIIFLITRNLFLLLKVFSRFKKLASFVESIHVHPAQTIFMSFLLVILGGTLLLMMPFTAVAGDGLTFLDALFTSTSAVCVTGLVVVDTATYFSIWGKTVIMILIQIGGLGIMILSYFTVFILRRSMSVADKVLISYMLSEDDMSSLARTMKSIVGITFIIEGAGMLILMAGFIKNRALDWGSYLFYSAFHAVSAFCNAGFALFSDSLESFSSSTLISGGISFLIIAGGISFGVLVNLREILKARFRRFFSREPGSLPKLTLNTRIVLIFSGWLLLSGTVLVYALEHGGALRNMTVGGQYLSAFFQSVTLRTAGFNSISFGNLATPMLVIMMIYMFVGAASGSTAGGIKINTVAVLGATVRAAWKNEQKVIISRHRIPAGLVLKAFLILLFGVLTVSIGTALLTVTETASLEDIMFETVSAFGTVGLSTGLTPNLSSFGRIVIIILMFIGRLGPLTVMSAASRSTRRLYITYPQAEISIG